MIRFVLPLVCAAGLQAPQPTGEERKPRPALPPAIRPVVELARAAPAEFFADTITRLVEGGKIAPKELEIELLQDAFTAAANAQEPIRLIAMPAHTGMRVFTSSSLYSSSRSSYANSVCAKPR